MLVHFGMEAVCAEWSSATVCMGTFDGVHRGHQALLAHAVGNAGEREQPLVVVTFDRHPLSILAPERVPPVLGTLEQNVIQMRKTGASACVILAFDATLSRTPAQQFLDETLVGDLRANQIVVGHDFAFGHQRQGTPDWLAERIDTVVFPPQEIDGRRVSSTLIRALVSEGRVEEAAPLLGRPFSLAGVVVRGQQLGRTLGYPTLNLARSSASLAPADGVYAGRARTPRGTFVAAMSLGLRPAVGGSSRTIEAHLLDYPGDPLYGAPVELEFWKFLRPETDFPDLDALARQMADDVNQTRAVVPRAE